MRPQHPVTRAKTPRNRTLCTPPLPSPRYAALASLGASPLHRVLTSGGGANNPQWMQMRQALLGVPASRAPNTDAAYGAAMLAASVAREY